MLRYIIPALVISAICSFRQPAVQTGIIYYHFTHIRDTTHAFRVWDEDFQLMYDDRQSVYLSTTKLQQDSAQLAAFEEAMRTNSSSVNMGVLKQVTQEAIYTNAQAIWVNRSFNQENYLVKEPVEKTEWRISTDTKQLLGYTCQKAEGIVKGRHYTAWFTTDIPAGFGPWKLQGLPGLILEAYDDKDRIHFTCTRIVPDMALHTSLEPPKDATNTTHADFKRMESAYREGLFSNSASYNDITVDNATVNGTTTKATRNTPEINYPLELTK